MSCGAVFRRAVSCRETWPPARAERRRDEIAREAQLLSELGERALHEDSSRVAKFTDADRHMKSRKRGRGHPYSGG